MTSSAAATMAQRIPSAPSSSRAYRSRTASKPRLTSRVSRPSSPCACTNRELITGESVTATMPETHHRRRQGDGELEEQRAGEPALERDRGVHRRQGDRSSR